MSDLEKAIQLDPKEPEGYFIRGYLKYRAGDRAGGRKDFRMSVALDSDHSAPYFARGVIEKRGLVGNDNGGVFFGTFDEE